MTSKLDVLVVGGGPAGLAAALWLARYRWSVLMLDAGAARNQPAWAVHGYPGITDPSPSELRRILRDQAIAAGAECAQDEVLAITGEKNRFVVETGSGQSVGARRVILAYGLRDYIPAIPGVAELYGGAVFHCPDCDGPSVAGLRVGVLGWDRTGAAQALYLLTWTPHITLLAHGCPIDLTPKAARALDDSGIALRPETIERVVASERGLSTVELEGGASLPLDALFFHLGTEPRCVIANQLGCTLDDEGYLDVDRGQETSVPGIYAAGDITGHPHLVVSAAAEGVRAALTIHRSLLPAERHV